MPFIPMLEPEVAAKATVPFSSIGTDLRRVMDEWGFAIVDGVLTAEECEALEFAWKTDLGTILCKPTGTGMKVLEDPARRWPMAKAPLSTMRSFASDFGLPQGRMAWGVRTHPHVRDVFATLHETNELCVGVDVVFFANGHPPRDETRKEDRLWPHCDHSRVDPIAGEWDVFQSVVYVWGADEDSSATVVWPKSHREEYDILQSNRLSASHYCPCGAEQTTRFAKHARRVPVRPGGMVVWNGNLIHQGWSLGPRLAMPVCFEPSTRRDEAALERKRHVIRFGDATTHWASLAYPHNCSAERQVVVEGLGTLVKAAHLWIQNNPEAQQKIDALL